MTNGFHSNGPSEEHPSLAGQSLGQVVGGSLSQGVEIRLDSRGPISVEDIKVGSFVTIQGSRQRCFGVVTDIELGSSDPRLKQSRTWRQFSARRTSNTFGLAIPWIWTPRSA